MNREFAETLGRMVKGEDVSPSWRTHLGIVLGCTMAGGFGFFLNEDCGFAGLFLGFAISPFLLLLHSYLEQRRATRPGGRLGPLSQSEIDKARAVLRRGPHGK